MNVNKKYEIIIKTKSYKPYVCELEYKTLITILVVQYRNIFLSDDLIKKLKLSYKI